MTPEKAFTTIRTKGKANTPGVMFVSRGDNSGTHSAEQASGNPPSYQLYQGYPEVGELVHRGRTGVWARPFRLASEKGGYTLTDEGTYLAYQGNPTLFRW